jgi:hypothetical protein
VAALLVLPSEPQFVEFRGGDVPYTPGLLAGLQGQQRRVGLGLQVQQRAARRDGVEVAKDLAERQPGLALLKPVDRVTRKTGAQR